jgi:hypothetical protein
MISLVSRKKKHISKVRNHILTLHNKAARLNNGCHLLNDDEFNLISEKLKAISLRKYQLRKHLNLLLF